MLGPSLSPKGQTASRRTSRARLFPGRARFWYGVFLEQGFPALIDCEEPACPTMTLCNLPAA